eukprot:scaffold28014_cov106-Isochrysis_galbana.AAC.2
MTASAAKDTRGAPRLVPPPTPASEGLRVGDASSGGATSSPADRQLRGQHDSLIISIARACSASKVAPASTPWAPASGHTLAPSPRCTPGNPSAKAPASGHSAATAPAATAAGCADAARGGRTAAPCLSTCACAAAAAALAASLVASALSAACGCTRAASLAIPLNTIDLAAPDTVSLLCAPCSTLASARPRVVSPPLGCPRAMASSPDAGCPSGCATAENSRATLAATIATISSACACSAARRAASATATRAEHARAASADAQCAISAAATCSAAVPAAPTERASSAAARATSARPSRYARPLVGGHVLRHPTRRLGGCGLVLGQRGRRRPARVLSRAQADRRGAEGDAVSSGVGGLDCCRRSWRCCGGPGGAGSLAGWWWGGCTSGREPHGTSTCGGGWGSRRGWRGRIGHSESHQTRAAEPHRRSR